MRAAQVAIPLLVALCATLFATVHHYNAQTALEATQRMNLGLARSVVEHLPVPLIGADGQPHRALMKELALHVMMINRAVDVYLLDGGGRVIAHALEGLQGADPVGRQGELAPVHQLVGSAPDALRFPVLGDDPRQPGGRSAVSVAAVTLDGTTAGYLYIILSGRALQTVTASLDNSEALRAVATGLVLATLLAAAVLVIALHKLTRPSREPTIELRAFRSEAQNPDTREPGDEIGMLRAAVHALQKRVAQQIKRLEDSDTQRRELISNISHDLRTPLSSIQGYVETVLLRGDQHDAANRTVHLRTALRHVELLGRRIADLFKLSKLDAGRVEPRREVFCLAELLQDVVQNYQLAAQQRGVRLSLAAGSDMNARVLAAIALIERVLQNLIDNALRYTVCGGNVTLALRAQGAKIEVSVSDTARGIAQEHLPHIFERYWRTASVADIGTDTSSGLGLAIVKRILDLHSSAVRVHSELTRGTRIEFGLPQAA